MVIEKLNRKNLIEGRNYGIGFTILEKVRKGRYKAYLPFTACRDFLNDIIYVENSNRKTMPEIYGFKYERQDIIQNKNFGFIGIKPLHFNNSTKEWKHYEEALKLFKENRLKLQEVLNFFEEKYKIPTRTKIFKDSEEVLIFKVPIAWLKTPPSCSLYTFLIRYFLNFKGDVNEESLFSYTNPLEVADTYYFDTSIKEFLKTMNFKKFQEKVSLKNFSKEDIHNYGFNSHINQIKYG